MRERGGMVLLCTATVNPKPESNNLETESRLNRRRLFFCKFLHRGKKDMSSHRKQTKKTQQMPEPSPWTEVFQPARDNSAETKASGAAEQQQTAAKPEDRTADPTRDALSAIFNDR